MFCVATLVSLLLVSPNVSAAASAGKLGREVIEVPGDLGLDAGIRDLGSACNCYRVDISK